MADGRAGCFGKLPIHAETIRFNADDPELEPLERWFQEGMAFARQSNRAWDGDFWQTPPARFLFAPPGSDRLVVGTWVAGSEKSGQGYPFAVSSVADSAILGQEAALAPVLFYDFLKSAQEVAVNGWSGAELALFQTRVGGLSCRPDLESSRKKYAQYLSTKTSRDIWTALFGSFENPKKYALVLNLYDRLVPLRDGTQPKLPIVLRFPLAPAVIPGFWLDLVLRMTKRAALPTLASWTTNTLTLLFHEPTARFFGTVFRPDLPSEHACELAKEHAEDPDRLSRAREFFGGILSEPTSPLPQVLQRIAEVRAEEVPAEEPAPAAPKPPTATSLAVPPPPQPAPAVEAAPEKKGDQDLRVEAPPGMTARPPGPVSCFGKLPIFADFIRHNANAPEIGALDQWFQEGITVARQTNRAWDPEFAKAPPTRFVFVSPETGRLVIGLWIASVDKPGRRYPFILYRISEQPPLGREGVLAPILYSDFFRQAEELAVGGWKGSDLKSYLARIDALSYYVELEAARKKYAEYLAGKTNRDLWTGLLGSFEDPRKYAIVQNLHELIVPLRMGTQSRIAPALRFPRLPGIDPTLWMDLALRMTGRPTLPPLTLWSANAFSIVFNELSPKYFVPLVRPDLRTEHVCDLTDGVDKAALVQRAKERYGAALDDPGLTLQILLQKLTGRASP